MNLARILSDAFEEQMKNQFLIDNNKITGTYNNISKSTECEYIGAFTVESDIVIDGVELAGEWEIHDRKSIKNRIRYLYYNGSLDNDFWSKYYNKKGEFRIDTLLRADDDFIQVFDNIGFRYGKYYIYKEA